MNHFTTLLGSLLPATSSTIAATGGSSSEGFWNGLANLVQANPLMTLYIVLAIVIVILFIVWSNRRSGRDFSVYQDGSGVAVISPKALNHLIEIACEEAGIASRPKIHLRQTKGRLNIELGIKLYQSQRLNQVHEKLRQQIRRTCEESHGIQVGDVNLKVIGFKKDPNGSQYYEASEPAALASRDTAEALPPQGEASAASLYEEPVEEALSDDTSAASPSQDVDVAEPKKRRFGFFGRRDKEKAELISEGEFTEHSSEDGKKDS